MDITGKAPEEIQELVDGLEKSVNDLTTELGEKTTALDEVTEENGKLEKALQGSLDQNEKLNAIIGKAKTQTGIDVKAAEKKEPVIPAEPIEVEVEVVAEDGTKSKEKVKKQAQWQKARFRLMGDITSYTAAEASKDPVVLKKLLSIPGQQILKVLD